MVMIPIFFGIKDQKLFPYWLLRYQQKKNQALRECIAEVDGGKVNIFQFAISM